MVDRYVVSRTKNKKHWEVYCNPNQVRIISQYDAILLYRATQNDERYLWCDKPIDATQIHFKTTFVPLVIVTDKSLETN